MTRKYSESPTEKQKNISKFDLQRRRRRRRNYNSFTGVILRFQKGFINNHNSVVWGAFMTDSHNDTTLAEKYKKLYLAGDS